MKITQQVINYIPPRKLRALRSELQTRYDELIGELGDVEGTMKLIDESIAVREREKHLGNGNGLEEDEPKQPLQVTKNNAEVPDGVDESEGDWPSPFAEQDTP